MNSYNCKYKNSYKCMYTRVLHSVKKVMGLDE